MSTAGPILILEDDEDDCQFYKDAIVQLNIKNKIIIFNEGKALIQYLETTSTKPFIILSDINLPGMNGMQVKNEIDADPFLKSKAIPFIFISCAPNYQSIDTAYKAGIQGYFTKPVSLKEVAEQLNVIFRYWQLAKAPN